MGTARMHGKQSNRASQNLRETDFKGEPDNKGNRL